jgi:hypothetical protein
MLVTTHPLHFSIFSFSLSDYVSHVNQKIDEKVFHPNPTQESNNSPPSLTPQKEINSLQHLCSQAISRKPHLPPFKLSKIQECTHEAQLLILNETKTLQEWIKVRHLVKKDIVNQSAKRFLNLSSISYNEFDQNILNQTPEKKFFIYRFEEFIRKASLVEKEDIIKLKRKISRGLSLHPIQSLIHKVGDTAIKVMRSPVFRFILGFSIGILVYITLRQTVLKVLSVTINALSPPIMKFVNQFTPLIIKNLAIKIYTYSLPIYQIYQSSKFFLRIISFTSFIITKRWPNWNKVSLVAALIIWFPVYNIEVLHLMAGISCAKKILIGLNTLANRFTVIQERSKKKLLNKELDEARKIWVDHLVKQDSFESTKKK